MRLWMGMLCLLLASCGSGGQSVSTVSCELRNPANSVCSEWFAVDAQRAAGLRGACRRDFALVVSRCERTERWVGACEYYAAGDGEMPAVLRQRDNYYVHPDRASAYPESRFRRECQRVGGRWLSAGPRPNA